MAIYAVGAYYDNDLSQDFIASNLIGVAWNGEEAPELHEYIKSLKVGDIVYIKSAFTNQDITVKAIGIIKDTKIIENHSLITIGRNIDWLVTEKFVIPRPAEKSNFRSNAIYEEFHTDVQKEIVNKIKRPFLK
jgi:hypothetical protein